ncbi:hypothetical protein C2E23DRAFT_725373 [Lenzites betulinus]|nr:hypothetical protein C2E23DRAFT_725373 [Lenzites betulinus]
MLPFVPRKVAQKAKTNIPTPKIVPATSSGAARTPPVTQSSVSSAKGKSKHTEPSIPDEDLATLLLLSLSDYALWLNTDLRRALATADDGCTCSPVLPAVRTELHLPGLPLSDIAHHSSYLSHPNLKPVPESAYVKAVRTCAPELLEVRMRVSAPSRAGWYGEGSSASQDDSGGYEIRRKDWRDALLRARNHTRPEWELRTVYMECLPLAHRTIPGVCHFASSLLSLSEGDRKLDTRIQAVSFPAHHNDRPGDIPKPKGFALIIFSNESDAARITGDWPWLPRRTSAPAQPTNAATEDERADDAPRAALAREAVKFGFRALPKARWDALKEEYTAYRQRLLDEIAQASTETNDLQPTQHQPRRHHHIPAANAPEPSPEPEDPAPGPTHQEPDTSAPAPLRPDAPFPPGCLVYLRGVHPETNKTTLKALLAAHGAALDYVDYNKGMSACHLRLSAPHHAHTLVTALTDRPLAQRSGLDSTGAPPDAHTEAKAIVAELVGGTREELYWSKVPEKVRREAVRKAIAQSAVGRGGGGGGGEEPAGGEGQEGAEGEGGHRKRKRRRKA